MNKKPIVVITGANSGIGKATAIKLAKTGAHIIMVCRNQERGKEALDDVIKGSNSNIVELMLCDLSSFQSIHQFCEELKQKFDQIDVLIHNAGAIYPKRKVSSDGFELQFQVNYLAPFLMTHLLLDSIKKAKGRIISVSSGIHKIGKMHDNMINLEKGYRPFKAYAQSKLAITMFTVELAERLKNTGVTVNCLHPGGVRTKIGIDRETGFGTFITTLFKPFFITPEEGAETSVYLATSNEVATTTGQYFYKKKISKMSKHALTKESREKLWLNSLKWTNLTD
jgi:NAD(P)-dependent dehydrogenase (short-subunit alcohol dehydrogenase family)